MSESQDFRLGFSLTNCNCCSFTKKLKSAASIGLPRSSFSILVRSCLTRKMDILREAIKTDFMTIFKNTLDKRVHHFYTHSGFIQISEWESVKMIKVEFSEHDLEAINKERFNHPVPRVQRRMEVLWLKSQGIPHKQITKLAGVCDNAVTKYLRLYQNGGLDEVKKTSFYQPKSELDKHSESIEQYFRDHPVSSISEAVAKIEKLTGIRRSKTQVRIFLRNLGMRFRKTGSVPSGADPEAQEAFKKNSRAKT